MSQLMNSFTVFSQYLTASNALPNLWLLLVLHCNTRLRLVHLSSLALSSLYHKVYLALVKRFWTIGAFYLDCSQSPIFPLPSFTRIERPRWQPVQPHGKIGDCEQSTFHSIKISEISDPKLNGTVKIPGKVFENLGIRFECTLFDGISGIIENFVFHSQEMSGLVSLLSVNWRGHLKSNYGGRSAIVRYGSLLATLQRNGSIYLSGKIVGRSDKLPVGIRPVCIISCVNNWHVSLVIRNSPDKCPGIVTSKYPFTRVNSLPIK